MTRPTMQELGLKKYKAICLDNGVIWYRTSALNLEQAKTKAYKMAQKQLGSDVAYFNYEVVLDA